jgi:hypothetical protein
MVSRSFIDGGEFYMRINLLGLGAAALAAGILAAPAAAFAADGEGAAKFAALTDPNPALVYPGKASPVTLGLANIGTAPADGVVVNIRVIDDSDLPRLNDNCRYYVDSNLEGAWCEIDGEVAVGTTYALDPFQAAAAPGADAKKIYPVIFQWVSKQWADEQGGIEKLAEADAGTGKTVVAGTGTTLRLVPASLTVPADPNAIGFAKLKLATPSTPPTTSPTPTTSTPTTAPAGGVTPSASPAGGGEGGGLAVTGAKTATVAGVGTALLAAGIVGYVVARRRRTRFVA